MEPGRVVWGLIGFVLLAAFLAAAVAMAVTGLHWAYWLVMVPTGIVMGWAFGRASPDAPPL